MSALAYAPNREGAMTKAEERAKSAFTGFGTEWSVTKLAPEEARRATAWVEAQASTGVPC